MEINEGSEAPVQHQDQQAQPLHRGMLQAQGASQSQGKAAPGKGCPSQQSTFTGGKKWGWTQRTCLVFLERQKEAEEFSGSDKGWAKFL